MGLDNVDRKFSVWFSSIGFNLYSQMFGLIIEAAGIVELIGYVSSRDDRTEHANQVPPSSKSMVESPVHHLSLPVLHACRLEPLSLYSGPKCFVKILDDKLSNLFFPIF